MLTLSVTVHPSDRLYLYHLEGDEVCVKVELIDALLDLRASHHVGMSKVNDDLSGNCHLHDLLYLHQHRINCVQP